MEMEKVTNQENDSENHQLSNTENGQNPSGGFSSEITIEGAEGGLLSLDQSDDVELMGYDSSQNQAQKSDEAGKEKDKKICFKCKTELGRENVTETKANVSMETVTQTDITNVSMPGSMKSKSAIPQAWEDVIKSNSLDMLKNLIEKEKVSGSKPKDGDAIVKRCIELRHVTMLQTLQDYLQVDLNGIKIDGRNLTEQAAVVGCIDTLTTLIAMGVELQPTVLSIGAADGYTDFVMRCLESLSPPLDINWQDRRMKSVIQFATERGYPELIEKLATKGADLEALDKRGRSILHSSAENGKLDVLNKVINLLLEQDLLKNILTARDKYLGSELCLLMRGKDQGVPAWHYVLVDRGLLDILKKNRGGSIDVAQYGKVLKSGWGHSPSQEEIIEVESKFDSANIPSTAAPDMQPLHLAILKKNTEVALRLIEVMKTGGKSLNEPDSLGMTPLHYVTPMAAPDKWSHWSAFTN